MEIALISNEAASPADFAFWWRACAIQYERDFLPAWKQFLVAHDLVVSGFTDAKDLKPGTHWPILCVGDTGDPGALGDHSGLRALWKAFGRFLPDSTVGSHEVLELAADPFCDFWEPIPGTEDVEAREVCDRTEGDSYLTWVDIGGVKRQVSVSNFLYPTAFGMVAEGANPFRFDHMGLLSSATENRGYQIVKHPDGTIDNKFADGMGADAKAKIIAKLTDPLSRTGQRNA